MELLPRTLSAKADRAGVCKPISYKHFISSIPREVLYHRIGEQHTVWHARFLNQTLDLRYVKVHGSERAASSMRRMVLCEVECRSRTRRAPGKRGLSRVIELILVAVSPPQGFGALNKVNGRLTGHRCLPGDDRLLLLRIAEAAGVAQAAQKSWCDAFAAERRCVYFRP